jgi:Sec-independent protein translocase protein TatA
MNILGIGGWELVLIFIIMLLVAGPKRMVRWAYVMGTYIAKFRNIWAETVDVIQQEFDDAGVDVKIPRDIPTRDNIRRNFNEQVSRSFSDVTTPVKETVDQVNADVREFKRTTTSIPTTPRGNGRQSPSTTKPATTPRSDSQSSFGSWSGRAASAADDDKPDFGTWSGKKPSEEE